MPIFLQNFQQNIPRALERSRLSRESLRPPIPCHVEPTETGLLLPAAGFKALLPVAGSEGGPWGWSMRPGRGCIMEAGGSEAMARPSRRSTEEAGAAAVGVLKAPSPPRLLAAAGARPEKRSKLSAGPAVTAVAAGAELKSANRSWAAGAGCSEAGAALKRSKSS